MRVVREVTPRARRREARRELLAARRRVRRLGRAEVRGVEREHRSTAALDSSTDWSHTEITMNAAAETVARHCDPEIFAVWEAALDGLAADLDLADEEDRVTFRFRVAGHVEPTSCYMIAALSRAAGRSGPLAPGRAAASRALADAWIARRAK